MSPKMTCLWLLLAIVGSTWAGCWPCQQEESGSGEVTWSRSVFGPDGQLKEGSITRIFSSPAGEGGTVTTTIHIRRSKPEPPKPHRRLLLLFRITPKEAPAVKPTPDPTPTTPRPFLIPTSTTPSPNAAPTDAPSSSSLIPAAAPCPPPPVETPSTTPCPPSDPPAPLASAGPRRSFPFWPLATATFWPSYSASPHGPLTWIARTAPRLLISYRNQNKATDPTPNPDLQAKNFNNTGNN